MASSDVSHLSQPCIYGQMESAHNQRKSGFMKWFSKLFKGPGRGTTNGRRSEVAGEENMFWHGPSRSMDDRSRAENEDLDHAIALSLAEDAKRRNGHIGRGHEDENFSRAIDESQGGMPSFCPYNTNPIQFLPRGFRLCGGCKQEIGCGHYLSCMGTFWHPQCFRCYSCAQPISETEFSLSGSYPYHKKCYKELHHPKCDICNQFIPTNLSGLIEYRAHPFWGQKYCPSHEHDSTPRCCSCERMESRSARYIALGDGRSLCLECLDSAIMDTGECQSLYHDIRDFYEGMYMKIDQQIPMLLVERQALNEAMEGERGPHHMPETRGLCLSEEQTVSSILKKPRIGKNRILDMRTYPQKLTRRCEVTAILVLYGLPRLLTGSILTHELMHGWLRLKGYRNLSPEVEEGICQLLSHMWLESEAMSGPSFAASSSNYASSSSTSSSSYKKVGKSETEKKLGEFFMHQIAHDISPAYGEGFRMAHAAVNRFGLRRTLDHIRYTGRFPI
ncbi:protein DA1-related 2 isoform X2 [Phalaenopsis equestris]|uniref:protein DA1-related 2 isoform X2 n=1 Tax=Phalaenopsis equestris TaxID=78828 RepID=UPI0009E466DF|nr:protein DA1-related 2 isoform X2 [Phalaenopsis equestris]